VSEANAKKFLELLEKEKDLQAAVNVEESMVKIAKVRDKNLVFTAEDLDKVIAAKWGEPCATCFSKLCFSEVPGF